MFRDKSDEELHRRAEKLAAELHRIHREMDRREVERMSPEQRRKLFIIIKGGAAAIAAGAAWLWTRARENPVYPVAAVGVAAAATVGGLVLFAPDEPPQWRTPSVQPTWRLTPTPTRTPETPTPLPSTQGPEPAEVPANDGPESLVSIPPAPVDDRPPSPAPEPGSEPEPEPPSSPDPGGSNPTPSQPPGEDTREICVEVADRPIAGGWDGQPGEGLIGLCVRDVLGVLD